MRTIDIDLTSVAEKPTIENGWYLATVYGTNRIIGIFESKRVTELYDDGSAAVWSTDNAMPVSNPAIKIIAYLNFQIRN